VCLEKKEEDAGSLKEGKGEKKVGHRVRIRQNRSANEETKNVKTKRETNLFKKRRGSLLAEHIEERGKVPPKEGLCCAWHGK